LAETAGIVACVTRNKFRCEEATERHIHGGNMTDYNKILFEKSGEVATVTFNNPKLCNAMDGEMLIELIDVCHRLEWDTDTRFAIFTGAAKGFMAGVDLKSEAMSRKGDPISARLKQRQGQELMKRMRGLEQITVAAVNGSCLGAGIALAIACDLRIASQDAIWGLPNVGLGYFFSWASTPLLVGLVGPAKAKELVLTCDRISSDEALSIGLVNKVVPPEQLMDVTYHMVDRIAANGPLAVRMAKKIANAAATSYFGDISVCEPELVERLYLSTEPVEGTNAFFEKRKPRFRHLQ